MTPTIQVLDEHAANQIAAGEVVERPLSVVKELVENALDAGASRIDIVVEGNGVPLISVSDNGHGIPAAQLPLALLRHATSKITRIEDLSTLNTLGFRGEALPSIASVSVFELSTRYRDELSGAMLKVQGEQKPSIREIGRPQGTTVSVRDLFFNTPARRKFLKSLNTEFGLISDMVSRLALARPDVAFTLTHPEHVVLKTPGRSKLLEAVAAVLGNDIARRLLPVSVARGNWQLTGYISPPDLVRAGRQGETFIINGRVIRSNLLSRSLSDSYHTLIPAKLHPIAVLQLSMPPAEYDVNVHPAKMEIRFTREQELAEFITGGIREVLLARHAPTSLGFKTAFPLPLNKPPVDKSPLAKRVPVNPEPIGKLGKPASTNPLQLAITAISDPMRTGEKLIITPDSGNASNLYSRAEPDLHSEPDVPDGFRISERLISEPVQATEPPAPRLDVWPLAQVFNTYILATDGSSLFIIDQHAAHERINYERILNQLKKVKPGSQELLIPLPLEFTLQEEMVLLEHLWTLREFGFIMEHFGPQTYLMRGIPDNIQSGEGESLIREFLNIIITTSKTPHIETLREEWAYLMACRHSVKARENLTLMEMEQLLAQLNLTENPFTCPHGRPTVVQISQSELEKRFYRTN